jgi:hypothetical protein
MPAILIAIGAWLVRFLVASLVARVATFVVVGYFSTSIAQQFINHLYGYLGQYPALQLLLLSGIGEAISIVTSAIVFRVSLVPTMIRPNIPQGD